ncbi:hypothetical protein J7E51_27715 [Priestia megaterium]|nr:hypothetical protein [Priestia megaterium]
MPERNCLLLYFKRKKAATCKAEGFSFFVLEHCASFAPSVSTGSMPVETALSFFYFRSKAKRATRLMTAVINFQLLLVLLQQHSRLDACLLINEIRLKGDISSLRKEVIPGTICS